ncbi:MAG: DUF1015 domain-containing protein [Dehalococcoidia bacterium]|nr:DUF1015 domain-containing protein [Dehalococcoidia bacterium]
MAEVYPLRGIRYNEDIVGDLASIICPPYDIIAPEEQKLYYERSDYNAIRLELQPEQPEDNATNNKYSRAGIILRQWLKQGVLEVDEHPAFYLHDHYFVYLGEERKRRGLIACVRLEPWGNGIYPHEETYPKAKNDRLQLMRACQANFSPLLSLYQDPERKVASILAEASQAKPAIEIADSGERHIVWAITHPKFQQGISQRLSSQALYIADGHHRYETALDYQKERTSAAATFSGKEAFNYMMMTLVEFSDPGLVVLPLHRLVRGISPSVLAGLKNRLEEFFILESVPLGRDSIDSSEPSHFGVLGLESGRLVFLKQRQDIPFETMMPGNRSQAYRSLAISLLNHVILDNILAFAPDSEDVAHTVNAIEAYQQIREGKYQLAFLLNPTQPETVKAIADAKDRMPRKSTYFYPKPPTGLIINSLD